MNPPFPIHAQRTHAVRRLAQAAAIACVLACAGCSAVRDFQARRWTDRAVKASTQGRPDEARAYLAQAVATSPTLALAWVELAVLAIEARDAPSAIDALHEALRHRPDSYRARHFLGVAYMMAGNHQQARSTFHEVLWARPDFAPTWYALGIIHEQEGDARGALECYLRGFASRETSLLLNRIEKILIQS